MTKQNGLCPTCGQVIECEIDHDRGTLKYRPPEKLAFPKDEAELVGFSDELHRRVHVQARNLLLEYRLSPSKMVPVEKVEPLMRLYGYLIAKVIYEEGKR